VLRASPRDPKVAGIRRAVRCGEGPRAGKWPRARGPGWAGPRGQRSPGGRKEPGKCSCRERYSISRVIMRKWEAARIRTHRERKGGRERERDARYALVLVCIAMRTCNLRERKGPFCPLFFPPRFIGLCFTSPPPPENAIRCAANAM